MAGQYKGLSSAEAAQRLRKNGENKLNTKKGNSIAAMFFSQFKDLMIIILAIATIISILMGQGAEAVTIIAIVLINATLGFAQEYRTEKTLKALAELSASTARVYRDGTLVDIASCEVVIGDVLSFEAGDKLAADCTASTVIQLACDEAMLTGESVPVHKNIGDKLYMGCVLTSGRGEALVTATGMNTEMGKIAHLVNEAEEEPTVLQIRLRELGKYVAFACVGICLAVGMLGYLQGNDFMQMLLTGISLAVAAIPEGLPAIVTITLALSVGRILRKGAVIRKLHAVETLGCAGVICADKTGTITQNEMTVRRIYVDGHDIEVMGDGYAATGKFIENGRLLQLKHNEPYKRIFTSAVLCCSATARREGNIYKVSGDPTELAVLVAAGKAGFERESLNSWHIDTENPFDSRRKRMSVTAHSGNDAKAARLFCKGAPDILLSHCTNIYKGGSVRPITHKDIEEIEHIIHDMAGKALRVLGIADSDSPLKGEDGMTFIGLLAMLDPPRKEVKLAVRRCRAAGVHPVMITGDYKDTALAVARETGIYRMGDKVLDAQQLDALSDTELAGVCMRTSVFARVSPAHKLRIVRAYKAAGQVVAMTGDGVSREC